MKIELKDFSKCYDSQKRTGEMAVSEVSFVCRQNEITGLVGENGSGKSTILKAVTGNHYATSGKVIVTDRDGNSYDASESPEKIKQVTGYVPEFPVLPLEMKTGDFIEYAGNLFGASKKEIDDVISKCGLQSVKEKRIRTLSKGFRQRVSFAQSLVSNPSILVLDEPFSGLDPAQLIQMRKLILDESKNKTVLISTHNLSEVHNLCSSILVMKSGKLVASGTEESLISQTESKSLEEAFLKL